MHELSLKGGSEEYEVCDDDVAREATKPSFVFVLSA